MASMPTSSGRTNSKAAELLHTLAGTGEVGGDVGRAGTKDDWSHRAYRSRRLRRPSALTSQEIGLANRDLALDHRHPKPRPRGPLEIAQLRIGQIGGLARGKAVGEYETHDARAGPGLPICFAFYAGQRVQTRLGREAPL
jgi:hypothetical protein